MKVVLPSAGSGAYLTRAARPAKQNSTVAAAALPQSQASGLAADTTRGPGLALPLGVKDLPESRSSVRSSPGPLLSQALACCLGTVRLHPQVGRSHRSSPTPVTSRGPVQGSGTAIRVGLSYERMGSSSSLWWSRARPTVCGYPVDRYERTKGRVGAPRPAP